MYLYFVTSFTPKYSSSIYQIKAVSSVHNVIINYNTLQCNISIGTINYCKRGKFLRICTLKFKAYTCDKFYRKLEKSGVLIDPKPIVTQSVPQSLQLTQQSSQYARSVRSVPTMYQQGTSSVPEVYLQLCRKCT